ncbi:MAG: hypothetical protein KDE09_21120, partial [Anaerolineales bacterium]|nr:hypothetical protein [Anaerolineales bacterium]
QFTRESIAAGEIPLWSPNLFAGSPFLANGQNSTYYPFSILFWLLPLAKAYGWFTLSQLWLAGALAYLFARVLGLRRGSAFLVGLVYQGNGFMLVSAAVFPMIIAAVVWLPLLLAAVERLVQAGLGQGRPGLTFPWLVTGAIGLGCLTLAGHPEILYYTLLVMAAYAGWRWLILGWSLWRERAWGRLIQPPAWLLALVVLGLMLGAIQFIPFYEVGQVNFREGANSLAEIRGWGFPERRILTLLLPDFFGNPSHHSYYDLFSGDRVPFTTNLAGQVNPHGAFSSNWGIKNYVEGGIYLGILPLLLAGLALWQMAVGTLARRTGRLTHLLTHPGSFFTLLSFFSLAFIFGTPLYAILYYGLPFINQLHSPFRWVFPLSLCVAVLAGYGAEQLAEGGLNKRLGALGMAIGLGGGALLLVGLLLTWLLFDAVEPTLTRLFLGLAQAQDAFPSAAAFFSYQASNGLILGLVLLGCGVVFWAARRHWRWPVPHLLAAALVIADLAIIGHGFNAATDPALLDFKPEMVSWLEENANGWRITSFDPKGAKRFNANAGWLYGLEDIRGYDSVILRQYTDYMGAIEPQNELLFNRIQGLADWNAINSPLVDLLGVKYIITQETLELPKLALAWEGEGVRIYENLAVMPRAYTIARTATAPVADFQEAVAQYDPRQYVLVEATAGTATATDVQSGQPQPAEVLARGNIELIALAEIAEPSWLILNDTYAPGWRVFVRPVDTAGEPLADEQELPITLVNGNFRGVQLNDSGRYEVRFRYSPTSFLVGGLTSLMGAVILLLGMIVWLWRRFF